MTLASASTAFLAVIAWSATKTSVAFRSPPIPSWSVLRRGCFTTTTAAPHLSSSATRPTTGSTSRSRRTTTSRLYSTGTSLPMELAKITDAFKSVGDDSLRHKQLLYMANQLPRIAPEKMIPENKVPGCLSTVYIDGSAQWSEAKDDYVIDYVGESDGLLTKGLVALLVRGLSGSTVAEIEAVPPEFIQEAQIGQSLTPGRNNGFLNMLAVMKKKAATIRDAAAAASSSSSGGGTTTASSSDNSSSGTAASGGSSNNDDDPRPMYNGIIAALQVLKPTKLVLVDNSAQHAGHAGSKGFNGESHFELQIVADAFEGLNLVKRHKLVYMLLGEIMPKIHALQISAKTPKEMEK